MPSKYYMPKPKESLLHTYYMKYIVKKRPLPTFPTAVQIQTKTGCNVACIFCPNRKLENKFKNVTMPRDLFRRIIDEIVESPARRISPYLMNEPLTDEDLPRRISYITQKKRDDQYSKINSNASALTCEMGERLLDSGLDRISFSVHGIVPEEYERTMLGLKLQHVLANIDRFLELKRSGYYKKPRIRVTMVLTSILKPQIPDILSYWKARHITVNIRGLENRAGHGNIQSREISTESGLKPFDWCDRIFKQAYILATGEMVLCCSDWERTTVMGDVRHNTILEVWNNEKYTDIRTRFLSNNLANTICQECAKQKV